MRWEWLGLAYFGYLAVVAAALPGRFGRARGPAFALAAAAAFLLVASSAFDLEIGDLPLVARALAPVTVLVAGYWLSGRFFVAPMRTAEGWLLRADHVLIEEPGVLRRYRSAHRLVRGYFELAYLLVYVVVPAGALTLALTGHADALDRFWATVLLSGLACYGTLPWIQTRPPRVLVGQPDDATAGSLVRRLNLVVLGRVSIQVNTIPSGHAACAVAVALAVGVVLPWEGLVFLVLAASITAATVLGRYHYAVDSILGVVLAFAVWALV